MADFDEKPNALAVPSLNRTEDSGFANRSRSGSAGAVVTNPIPVPTSLLAFRDSKAQSDAGQIRHGWLGAEKARPVRGRNGIGILLGGAVLAASAIIPMPVGGKIAGIPTFCPFHLITGHPCPGCGLTRSFVCLAHGHIRESIAYHPFGPVLFGLIAVYVVAGVLRRFGIGMPEPVESKIMMFTGYACGVLLIGIWAARLSGLIAMPADL